MKRIGIIRFDPAQKTPEIINLLAACMGMCICDRANGDYKGLDGIIYLGGDSHHWREADKAHVNSCQIFRPVCASGRIETARLSFSNSRELPPLLRDETVVVQSYSELTRKKDACEGECLASIEQKPVWTFVRSGTCLHFGIDNTLPPAQSEHKFYHFLVPEKYFSIFPLIDFLTRCKRPPQWCHKPLRACLVFDDPNLHSFNYGFLNYRQLLDHAKRHRYHVAFAIVPLDLYYANRAVVNLFATNERCFSLLCHGSGHQRNELGVARSRSRQNELMSDALSRIIRFESSTGLRVNRVVAPPHGACTESMMGVMAGLGFEALCSSYGAIGRWNANGPFVQHLGANAGNVVSGMSIIPRFGFRGSLRSQALVAALQQQPIIFAGHHQDLAHGLDVLRDAADAVNSFPDVAWLNMEGITRSMFQSHIEGNVMHVKMLARRIKVEVPLDVKSVVVHRPWLQDGEDGELLDVSCNGDIVFRSEVDCITATDNLSFFHGLDLSSGRPDRGCPRLFRAMGWRPMALARRIAAEMRDRLQPLAMRSGLWQ